VRHGNGPNQLFIYKQIHVVGNSRRAAVEILSVYICLVFVQNCTCTMACEGPLVDTLKNMICSLEGPPCPDCPGVPYCPAPQSPPHIMCCHVRPPPICAPTSPEPVKPLRLPCQDPPVRKMTRYEGDMVRFNNFYNNYNIDWRADSPCDFDPNWVDPRANMKCAIGVTVDGKCPYFPKCKKPPCCDKGCPTGFQPVRMRLTPPADRHPCGLWCGELYKCIVPPRRCVKGKFVPALPCCRFCCIHTNDHKCKASCFSR
ncbi:unnamed protein product, partial [Phyllotreta striolata]